MRMEKNATRRSFDADTEVVIVDVADELGEIPGL
jgi:hypothetical protein